MTYKEWLDEFLKKRQAILKKLKNKEIDEVIEYFDFENMKINEIDFCLLYKENKKCHNIKNINCFFCACPHFLFDDNGIEQIERKTIFSKCYLNSKEGSQFDYGNSIHQDCSKCHIPHKNSYVKANIKEHISQK